MSARLLPDGIVRLEYSKRQGLFHFDNGEHEENTYGWETIDVISEDEASIFCDFMDMKYLDAIKKDRLPGIHIIRTEYELFKKLKALLSK